MFETSSESSPLGLHLGEEAIRCKRLTKQRAAVRDLLSNAIADYNKVTANKVGDTISSFWL